MIYLLNAVIVLELLLLVALVIFTHRNLRAHWRTSIAGWFVIGLLFLITLLSHGIRDTVQFASILAVGIGLLIAADGN